MILVVGVILLAGLGLVVHAAVVATRTDDLLVFYWDQAGVFVFARNPRGRYDRVPLWKAPGAALHFYALRLRARLRRPRPAAAVQPVQPARFARLAH